jgi:hypothetical protein
VDIIALESTPGGTNLVGISICVSIYVIDRTSCVLTKGVFRVVTQVETRNGPEVRGIMGYNAQCTTRASPFLVGLQAAEVC